MDCEKVRDRFSSLWEKEVSSFEEKILREHLSSCSACRREFEKFERTMEWLHSVGEVEVPEGFLPELHKKREEKKGAVPGEGPRERWFHFPLSFKLPAQAVAMVAIVFLVLYLTKMMPMEGGRPKETKQISSPLSVQEKPEQGLTPSAAPPRPELGSKASPISEGKVGKSRSGSTVSEPSPLVRQADRPEQSRGTGWGVEALTQKEGKRGASETSRETPHPRDSEQAKPFVPGEKKREGTYAPEIPPPRAEIMAYPQMEPKGAGREKTPSSEPGKMGRELAAQEKSLVATKPPQEIVLKISDRRKVIPRLHELVKQFGGEVVATERDSILASLPRGSFSEFEKELAGFSSSAKADRLIARKHVAGSLRPEEGAKREEGEEKSKGLPRLPADAESRTIVRILLVEE
jgi:hypothetical protein